MRLALTGTLLAVLTIAIASPLAADQAQVEEFLIISADIPTADIAVRRLERIRARLPSLTYSVSLEAKCRPGLRPNRLSLSVADTRKTVATESLSVPGSTSVSITIPAAQLAPVAVGKFCLRNDREDIPLATVESGSSPRLGVKSILSLQGALLCSNESESQMLYASQSLDVELSCRQPR